MANLWHTDGANWLGDRILTQSCWLRLTAVVAVVLATSAGARAETEIKPMLWDDCLAAKAEMQARLDVGPKKVIEIVKSAALDVTRLCTKEGAVAISCSRANQTLIVSVRPQQSELSCLWRSLVLTDT
jgi:hypothetical protein